MKARPSSLALMFFTFFLVYFFSQLPLRLLAPSHWLAEGSRKTSPTHESMAGEHPEPGQRYRGLWTAWGVILRGEAYREGK